MQFLVESLLIVLVVVLTSYAHGLPIIVLVIMLSKQNMFWLESKTNPTKQITMQHVQVFAQRLNQ
jgi:hypothetical protein